MAYWTIAWEEMRPYSMGRRERWWERVDIAVLISVGVGGRMACRRVSILLIGPGVIGLMNIEGGAREVSVIE